MLNPRKFIAQTVYSPQNTDIENYFSALSNKLHKHPQLLSNTLIFKKLNTAAISFSLRQTSNIPHNFPGKYVSIAYGTNDAWGNTSGTEQYYNNMEYMVKSKDLLFALYTCC